MSYGSEDPYALDFFPNRFSSEQYIIKKVNEDDAITLEDKSSFYLGFTINEEDLDKFLQQITNDLLNNESNESYSDLKKEIENVKKSLEKSKDEELVLEYKFSCFSSQKKNNSREKRKLYNSKSSEVAMPLNNIKIFIKVNEQWYGTVEECNVSLSVRQKISNNITNNLEKINNSILNSTNKTKFFFNLKSIYDDESESQNNFSLSSIYLDSKRFLIMEDSFIHNILKKYKDRLSKILDKTSREESEQTYNNTYDNSFSVESKIHSIINTIEDNRIIVSRSKQNNVVQELKNLLNPINKSREIIIELKKVLDTLTEEIENLSFSKKIFNIFQNGIKSLENEQYTVAKQYKLKTMDELFGDFNNLMNDISINNIADENKDKKEILQIWSLNQSEGRIMFKKGGKEFNFTHLSSGEIRVVSQFLNLYDKIINKKDKYVYLIDEIGIGFHPYWNSNILKVIETIVSKNELQFFVSTHSSLIPFSIKPETDIMLNMNELLQKKDEEVILSFKKYYSIQNFVNEALDVNYRSMIDEFNVIVEGRTDKELLQFAMQKSNKIMPFNIIFQIFLEDKEEWEPVKDIVDGCIGVQNKYFFWCAGKFLEHEKRNKIFFIFDSDKKGTEYFDGCNIKQPEKKSLDVSDKSEDINSENNKMNRLCHLKIDENINKQLNVFKGFKATRVLNKKEKNKELEETAFVLCYKTPNTTIEDMIKDEEAKKIVKQFKKNKKLTVETLNSLDSTIQEKIASSLIPILEELLKLSTSEESIKTSDNN